MGSWYPIILLYTMSVSLYRLEARFTLSKNVTVPALFGFGDSIIDPGNNDYIHTTVKSNYRPYGINFTGGKPTGRFSNGRIPTDFIAEKLGLKELLPAYLDPSLKTNDLLTGVSFASGGAGFDPRTSKLTNVIGMSEQLKLFEKYARKLKVIVGEERREMILNNSIYIVSAGNNDFLINYYHNPYIQKKYGVDAYIDFLLQKASSFIQDLRDLGARRIGVLNIDPIGCLPIEITLSGNKTGGCSETRNQVASLYNSKLLETINRNFQGEKVVYVDIYNPLLDIRNNAYKYGFDVVNKGCCTEDNEYSVRCSHCNLPICDDISKYLFWDSAHPTEKAYVAS